MAAALGLALCQATAMAGDGKLALTGGVSTVDGAAGGGLSPWALIGSAATEGQWGATAHLSGVRTRAAGLLATRSSGTAGSGEIRGVAVDSAIGARWIVAGSACWRGARSAGAGVGKFCSVAVDRAGGRFS